MGCAPSQQKTPLEAEHHTTTVSELDAFLARSLNDTIMAAMTQKPRRPADFDCNATKDWATHTIEGICIPVPKSWCCVSDTQGQVQTRGSDGVRHIVFARPDQLHMYVLSVSVVRNIPLAAPKAAPMGASVDAEAILFHTQTRAVQRLIGLSQYSVCEMSRTIDYIRDIEKPMRLCPGGADVPLTPPSCRVEGCRRIVYRRSDAPSADDGCLLSGVLSLQPPTKPPQRQRPFTAVVVDGAYVMPYCDVNKNRSDISKMLTFV
eukprot:PhM_4_TR8749/c0_g1_i1/m.7957